MDYYYYYYFLEGGGEGSKIVGVMFSLEEKLFYALLRA